MKIINTFLTTGTEVKFYDLRFAKLVYENGDYRIFKRFPKSFVHTYKNWAFAELTGASRKLVDCLASGDYSPYQNKFVLDRAVANREKGGVIANSMKKEAKHRKRRPKASLY